MRKRGKINFIHWSDSHLGYFRFGRTDVAGVNQRMLDFHDAFNKSVDLIIKAKPDFTIHSGDLFESYHPPNRSRDIAIDALEKLNEAGVPTIILSGTHDIPKIKRDTHVFDSVTRHQLKNIYMVKAPDKIDLTFGDERVAIYCVPYSPNFEEMKAWFIDTVSESKGEDAFNILVLHCDIAGAFKI